MLRKNDDIHRLHYTLISTFLGRMCISGDIYDLNEVQWDVVQNAIAFYRMASDIIKNGNTLYIENHVISYSNPQGEQIVIRRWGKKLLIIAHRFKHSKPVSTDFLNGKTIIAEFGEICKDFSAKAWIVEET